MLLDGQPTGALALIDARSGETVTIGEILADAVHWHRAQGRHGLELAFLLCDGSSSAHRAFLGLVEARVPVALMDAGMDALRLEELARMYAPVRMIGPATEFSVSSGRVVQPDAGSDARPLHPDLAVLLTTSGSTGSAKLVRLSAANVRANAEQIAGSLNLTAQDRGMTSLPLHYSYGMSVVTSHALSGSAVVVSPYSVLQKEYWGTVREHAVTILPGVPQTYAMLKRLGMPPTDTESLRAMTQAGGRLSPDLVNHFAHLMNDRGGEFFVMYGQTEASPRIACLPPMSLPEKLGSAGVALDGGRLVAMDGDRELDPFEVGEIVYSGPNVMMGYAESRSDLALGDTQGGTLRTGDLGYLDEEGFLFLTGRSKRIAKLAGVRVSLDEVEALVPELAPAVAVDAGDSGITLYTEVDDVAVLARGRRELAQGLGVPPKLVSVRHLHQLPVLSSGKIDYQQLTAMAIGDAR